MKLKNQALRTGLRAAAFLLVLGTLFTIVAKATNFRSMDYALIDGLIKEPEDSLDAIFIGGSDAFTFWEGPLAWHKYRITARPCGATGLPMVAKPYYIELVRKTQPNALYVVLLRPYTTDITAEQIHWMADAFPLSLLKVRIVEDMANMGGYSAKDKVAFYIPFVQYHTLWLKFNGLLTRFLPGDQTDTQAGNAENIAAVAEDQFAEGGDALAGEGFFKHVQHVLFDRYSSDKRKATAPNETFLYSAKDVTSQYHRTEERAVLSDECRDFWNGFLDDLDANGTRVLFVIQPTAKTLEDVREFNSVKDLVTARGYPVLDLNDKIDEIGLDLKTDYTNEDHQNVHGAIPYTDYMARYLMENYGFEDKRGQPGFESWDEAYDLFSGDIMPVLSDEEIAMIQ